MALTTTVRITLDGKGFGGLFEDHKAKYEGMVQTAYEVMAGQVPGGQPTIDDVKKVLLPMVELDRSLRTHLGTRKCTEKHWISDFTDYVLDEVMQPSAKPPKNPTGGKNGP
jgi:hypothetical protein